MKIAIVDDEPSICRSLERLLRLVGMNPTAFASAEAFLASPLRSDFGCVLLDIQFKGGMSGLQLRQRMLDGGERTPVIFLTALDDAETRRAAQRMGCEAFLRKGDDPMVLVELLRAMDASSRNGTARRRAVEG